MSILILRFISAGCLALGRQAQHLFYAFTTEVDADGPFPRCTQQCLPSKVFNTAYERTLHSCVRL
ncbi:hypothetical protein ARMGADRAFT_1021653 [Armillaria gallica]|uniref:Secreted protein n=1 Tax=Armillaria gallica TaxID=47427 RepID=A0A2H3CV89_ARMGA|nr:hypothetical protein ARMGADRAFT_1021652 [Armillaria gallica]PBK79217.1 hypothetical protein ARMGADRAFT_1021653 [Armillaria gallica]